MPPLVIYNTQLTVTSIFISRMGYPRHLPRCVVYAPKAVGGLGMRHLRQEQGVQQTLHLLRHLRANTSNGKLYALTIDQYQIVAGTQQPVLEDLQPIPWLPTGWISSIRNFLYTNSCKIQLLSPWTPAPRRIHDRCLMQDIRSILPPEHHKTLNSVRMYLRIFMLSDITESNGRELMHSMLDESATPARTRIQWPYQPSPTKAAWKVWAKSMRTLYTTTMTTNMLHTPLGLWLPYPSTQHKSDWYACPDKLDLYRKHGTRWQRFRIQHQ